MERADNACLMSLETQMLKCVINVMSCVCSVKGMVSKTAQSVASMHTTILKSNYVLNVMQAFMVAIKQRAV